VIYKFNTLSRVEIEAMFTLEDLKQTRYIQDLIAESQRRGEHRGEQRGIQRNKLEMIPQLIQVGLSLEQIAKVVGLPLSEVEKAAQTGSP
jgi:predicted transposase/invertase (TIGR01784 family)